jgi:primosomal protein N' (replication factor Y)
MLYRLMKKYSTVILTIPNENGFTYAIPKELGDLIQPGVQVIVPFGRRFLAGIVLALSDKAPASIAEKKIKAIHDLVAPEPVLTPELMKVLQWMSEYYVCHLGDAYRLIQSNLNVGKSRLMIQRLQETIPTELTQKNREIWQQIPLEKEISYQSLGKKVKSTNLNALLVNFEKMGIVQRRYSEIQKKKALLVQEYVKSIPQHNLSKDALEYYQKIEKRKNSKTSQLLDYLQKHNHVLISELNAQGFSRQVVNQLLSHGLLEKIEIPRERSFDLPYHEKIEKVKLTDEQIEVIQKIEISLKEKKFSTFLLHGITGSGKTQIYIELIQKSLEIGRTAIVLIPEIVLTPQTLGRFRAYFGDQVAVLHSQLSAGEKREVLHQIRKNRYSIVLGPRSAIFAPLQNLGIIIVDEEHESSYKQSDSRPHYHARDVAIYRARLNESTVVLGSATPSFESLYNVKQGVFQYFKLGKRIESRNLPRIQIVDLKEEWKKSGAVPIISDGLELKIESRLLTKEQLMILQNRRGYAPYIICMECGYVAKCQNCDITLTYHRVNKRLVCHYCGHAEPAPDGCPQCEGVDIVYKGIGTQKLEEVLQEKFPETHILRMDQDTVRGKFGHATILEQFRRGDADILLGTKMIAKGLDFQRVTLVGVVLADQGLHFPDFRAAEKVFQLLTQAAGRAGRGSSSGEVVVQTYDPTHYIYKFITTHNYQAFYEREIKSRDNLKYPPFSRLILIKIEGKDSDTVRKYGETITNFLWKAKDDKHYTVLGPAPSPIAKIQNVYRYQVLIKQDKSHDDQGSYLRRLLKQSILDNTKVKKWPVKIHIDVDPIDIL